MKAIHAFLLLPASTENPPIFLSNDDFVERETLQQFILELEGHLELAYSEKWTSVWYDRENIGDFLSNFDGFQEEYLTNLPERMQDVLASASDWRETQRHSHENRYFLWDLTSETAFPLYHAPHTLSEIAERLQHASDEEVVLLNVQALRFERDIIPVIKDRRHTPELPQVIIIPFVNSAHELATWLTSHRQRRIFHLNPKHGESGKHRRHHKGEDVAFLLCNQEQAQQLLDIAVGNQRITRELYAFDKKYQKYIVFKDENTPKNTYHGYHVDEEHEVPESIRIKIQAALQKE